MKANQTNTDNTELTVVLCDIINSTSLMAKSGDSEFKEIIRNYFDRLQKLSSQYDAFLMKFLGDGCLIAFYDPSKAVNYAIELQTSLITRPIIIDEQALSNRIAVHTSSALIVHSKFGEDLIGAGISLVARLSNVSKPNQVVISESTYRLLPDQLADKFQFNGVFTLKHAGEAKVWSIDIAA